MLSVAVFVLFIIDLLQPTLPAEQPLFCES